MLRRCWEMLGRCCGYNQDMKASRSPAELLAEPHRETLQGIQGYSPGPDFIADLGSRDPCPATRSDGTRCVAQANTRFGGYCIGHWKRAPEARRKGGIGRSTVRRLMRKLTPAHQEMDDALKVAMQELQEGRMEPARAAAMAKLVTARLMVRQDSDRSMQDIEAIHHLENRMEDISRYQEAKDTRMGASKQTKAKRKPKRRESPLANTAELDALGTASTNGHGPHR